MDLRSRHRRDSVFLVDIGDQHALVDQQTEQVHILNAPAAWVWSRLGTETSVPDEFAGEVRAFLVTLEDRQLLASEETDDRVSTTGQLTGAPELLATAPLQVAAGNSDDPFGDDW